MLTVYFSWISYLGGDIRTRVAAGTLQRQSVASYHCIEPIGAATSHTLLPMSPRRQFAFLTDARTVTRTAVPHSFQPRDVRSLFRSVGWRLGAGKGRFDSWATGDVWRLWC